MGGGQLPPLSPLPPVPPALWATGVSSLGLLGVPWHPQILVDQLTLSQPEGADYVHHITTGTPGFSDLPTALHWQ